MKEIFKEKYLKYEPKITLEIFTLVWNKLIELGYKSFANYTVEERYDEFKGHYSYFRTTQEHPNEFSCYSNTDSYTEITVEEILGYNPFIKDDFVLPKKWCIKIQANGIPYEVAQWRKSSWSNPGYMSSSGTWNCDNAIGYPEITLDQFKKYVLKEAITSKDWSKATEEELLEEAKRRYPIGCKVKLIRLNVGGDFGNEVKFTSHLFYRFGEKKELYIDGNLLLFTGTAWAEIESLPEVKNETKEVIPEYVKLLPGFDTSRTGEIFDTKRPIPDYPLWTKSWTWEYLLTAENYKHYFKPSTKEAYDKQVKELIGYKEQKPIEKWSAGSYIVFLQNEVLTRSGKVTKGKIYQLIQYGSVECPYFHDDNNNIINFVSKDSDKYGLKWFATKYEAEEFAKTLVEPAKEEIKQPLKQAVHCTTQEEWDFVKNKINRDNDWEEDYPCQILVGKTPWKGGIQFCIDEGIQILSFQEWCNLNNYSIANKKYTIKELETNRKLIIYISSKEEHDKIQKYSKRLCNYYGNYCYSLYEKTYSSSSSKSCPGAYKDSIILTIDDIIFKDEEISDESYIGKYVSFNYNERFYDKAFIIRENSYIYLLNNCHSNNNGHINKSIYKYSLRFDSIEEMLLDLKNIKFLDFKDIEFKPLTEDDLILEVVKVADKIKLNYLPEPD